jgi:hypothetical protein
MQLTPCQQVIYNLLLSMNNNGPLTAENRATLLAIDMSKIGLTDDDKKIAIRHYEHNIGLILEAA